jgi:nitrate reductase gamma subunit
MGMKYLFFYLPYLSLGIFSLGILYRFWRWAKTPVPLRIVVPPAPKSRPGIIWRMVGDVLLYPNLFRGDRLLWTGGFLFHIFLWLVVLRHLRYFLYPVPGWVAAIQTPGLYAGYLIPLPLAFLLARRLLIDRVLYISILGDYFALVLLLAIAISGVMLKVFFRTYIVDVKALVLGLIHFQPLIADAHWLFGLHFLLVMVLLIYFPFGKLMHSAGLILSPTRNQRANFAQRFVNPWDFPVSYSDLNLSSPEKYAQTLTASYNGEKE